MLDTNSTFQGNQILNCRAAWLIVFIMLLSPLVWSAKKNTVVIIENATIIDMYSGAKHQRDIIIEDDRITDIQPQGTFGRVNSQQFANAKVINATGQYAIPGLWDMHVHMTYIAGLQNKISALNVANGVTSVRDMGGELQHVLAFQRRASLPGSVAPQLWISGPWVDGSPPVADGLGEVAQYPAMSIPVNTPEAAVRLVDQLAANGVHFIKPYEMVRPEVFSAMVKRAHHHGLPVDGHVPQRMTISEAIAAGMDGIVHMKGVDYGCSRNPQALRAERVAMLDQADEKESGAKLWIRVINTSVPKAMAQQDSNRCDTLIQLFVEHGTWHTPGLSTEAFLSKSSEDLSRWYDRLQYLPVPVRTQKQAHYDSLKGGHKENSKTAQIMVDKYAWKQQIIKKMHKAGVKLLAGTDAPALILPGFGLHDELEELVQAGLSPLAALQTATINPAHFFNVETEQGAIEVGKVADIVLLKDDPLAEISNTRKIDKVILRGRVFDRTTLDSLLLQ